MGIEDYITVITEQLKEINDEDLMKIILSFLDKHLLRHSSNNIRGE